MAQEDENPSKKRQDLHRYDAAREDVSDAGKHLQNKTIMAGES